MRFIVIISLLSSVLAFSKGKVTELKDGRFLLSADGFYTFTSNKADSVSGAVYTAKFRNPFVANISLGFRLFSFLYFGARYEQFFDTRKMTLNGVSQEDTLGYRAVGGEVGYWAGNPRIHWILSGSVFYPIACQVDSKTTSTVTYTRTPPPLMYEGKLTLGVKFNSRLSLRFHTGYRSMNLGNLTRSSVSFLPNGDSFDLSGPFIGAGLGFHF